jgi:hypothetical protein
MVDVKIEKSDKPNKKYKATINGSKTVHFGATGYSDHLQHKDDKRKSAYIARHKARENWNLDGVETAGFWSRWIGWNKKTLKASVDDLNKRFKSLKVKVG